MIEFWWMAAVLALGSLAVIGWTYWRSGSLTDTSRQQVNKLLYQERSAELKQDLARGLIGQSEFDALLLDLQLSLLSQDQQPDQLPLQHHTRAWPWLVGATLFLFGVSAMLYLKQGNYGHWVQWQQMAQQAEPLLTELVNGKRTELPEDFTETQFRSLMAGLQHRTLTEQDNAKVWYWLGRLGTQSSIPEQGVTALERAERLDPTSPEIQLALAQAQLQSGNLQQGVASLRRLLDTQPNHPGALMLLAMQQFTAEDYQGAIELWQRFLQQETANPKIRQIVENAVARSQQLLQQQRQGQTPTVTPAADPALPVINVEVELDPSFAGVDLQGKQLVVFAKAAEGPPMPLAVVRALPQFPAKIRLDDGSAMMPELKLSAFPNVIVTARLTSGSDVMAKPGDLEGISEPLLLKAGSQSVTLRLNRQR